MKCVEKAIKASFLAFVGIEAFLPSRNVLIPMDNPSRASRRITFSQNSPPPCRRRSTSRVQMSWENLAAEWAARNRDDGGLSTESSGGTPASMTMAASNNAEPIMSATASQSFSTFNGHTEISRPGPSEVAAVVENTESLWHEIDQELLEIQREASEALLGLESIQEEIESLTDALLAKDERYKHQIRQLEAQGSQLESELQGKLASMASDFEKYRSSTETEREAFLREADSKQGELRNQIDDLQSKLQEQMEQLKQERAQSTELKSEKSQLDEELQRMRRETSVSLKEWEERVRSEQQARARETQGLEIKLEKIQKEASFQMEESIQMVEAEKEQIERDFSTRLEELSNDLKAASYNIQDAQEIIDEKQRYIESLEPAVMNLADWTRESWVQLNRIQDAVGLPMTPLDQNGEIPSADVLEIEAQNLIDHLRTRERYFEDAMFDIQTEMQEKERKMKSRLNEMEQEYDDYRREMNQHLDASRQDATTMKESMQAQLNKLESDMEEQRRILTKESQRAVSFMEARMAVEKELAELKREASYVVDELEKQLEFEQLTRRKESERAKKALADVEKLSLQKKREAIAKEKEKLDATEQELSSRVAETRKELEASKLTTGFLLSVTVGCIGLLGIVIQGFRPHSVPPNYPPKNAEPPVEKLSNGRSLNQINTLRSKTFSFGDAVKDEKAAVSKEQKTETPSKSKENSPGEPSSSKSQKELSKTDENDVSAYVPPRKNFFYAIKEEGTASTPEKGDKNEAPPNAKVDRRSSSPDRQDTDFKPPTESTASKKDDAKLPLRQDDSGPDLGVEKSSGRKDPDKARPSPTEQQSKEKGFSPPISGKAPNVESAAQTTVQGKTSVVQPSEDDRAQRQPVGKDSNSPYKEEIPSDPKTPSYAPPQQSRNENATPSSAKSTEEDSSSVDWDALTTKWLDEVKQIQDSRAKARDDPTKPIDMTFSKRTDLLNDPLLQQALAPAPVKVKDPFVRGTVDAK